MFTKAESKAIDAMPTMGYWSALGGVEVKQVEYGIEDYIICMVEAWTGNRSAHRLRIKYDAKGRDYIEFEGTKLYLSECIRNP